MLLCWLRLGCVRAVDDDYKEGLRFYRPAPYLLVTLSKDGPITNVIWLPGKNQEYYVKQNRGWGVSNLSVKLDSGWNLVELGSVADSKGPETLAALGSIASAAAGFKFLANSLPLEPGLYEVLFTGGKVSGLRRVPLKFE